MSRQSPAGAGAGLGAQARRQLPMYVVGTLLLAGLQTLMSVRDRLFKSGVDAALAGDQKRTVVVVSTVLVVVVVAAGIRVLSRMTVFHAGRMVEYELRARLLGCLHVLGGSFFRRMPTGEIMSRATNDLGQVRLLFGFGALNLVNTVFALASAVSVMASVSWTLTLAALAPFPLLIGITRSYGRALFARNRQNQKAIGMLSERVQSSLAGVRVVRAFCLENAEQRAFEKVSQEYLDKALALARLRGSMGPTMAAIAALGMLVVFWYGGVLVVDRRITEGDFVAFWAALARLSWPIMAFGFVLSILQRGKAAYARLREIFDASPDVVDRFASVPATLDGALEVRNLSFSHGDQPVLSGVSFRLDQGQSVAVVGPVGSGKSTLAALLVRLLPTPTGAVFVGGQDITEVPLTALRATIGFAQQDAFLFSTTVARNIAYGLDDPDSEAAMRRCQRAAEQAQLLPELQQLRDGFDTIVGERGLQLSGGQKQRVALARALLLEPTILVLDDPLSAVDAETETAILDAISQRAQRRSMVLITSRIAAAARCDRVLVLERGRVIEHGTPQDLERSGGLYARLAEVQRLEGEIEKLGQVAAEQGA